MLRVLLRGTTLRRASPPGPGGAQIGAVSFLPRFGSALNPHRSRRSRQGPAEARTPERTGAYSFERNEAARLSPAEENQLRADARAAAFFDDQPPWYQRAAIHWVISAKREETRARRLEQLIGDSARSKTVPPLTSPARKRAAKRGNTR
ncbi:MAG TPA: YdeI/OmpD-associated family protein [Longimicrobiales bacterium]|nr:YdeI/OmpD-associated family protein [Longimicrobiales bacterium]